MRIGLVLDGTSVDAGGAALRAAAARLEDLGFDLVWLRQDERLTNPFLAATVVGTATTGLRVGVEVELGAVHPVVTAEQAAVCDLALRGRLVLGLRPAPEAAEDFAEAVELVVRAHRPLPFSSEGRRWPTPARLAANRFMRDRTVRVTPAPAQLELPTWLLSHAEVARRFGLSPLVDVADGAAVWDDLDPDRADHLVRRSRPALVDVPVADHRLDHDALIATLLEAREGWGLDTALLALPADLPADARDGLWADLARIVRPRVQQEQLPTGLVEWWDEELLADAGHAR